MDRRGLYIALALAVVIGGAFAIFPGLDLKIATLASSGNAGSGQAFAFGGTAIPSLLRRAAPWVGTAFIAACIIAVLVKLVRPRVPLLIPGRAIILMIATMVLAPGIVANGILKEHWSRPRPNQIEQFGGSRHFVPWWDPRGDCPRNCSFVSGEAAGSFWTLAPAAVTPLPWRPLAYAGAIAFGSAISVVRMLAGGHFFSDVFFAGIFTFLTIWLVYALLYRWPATRITDEAVDAAIGSFGVRLRSLFTATKPPRNL